MNNIIKQQKLLHILPDYYSETDNYIHSSTLEKKYLSKGWKIINMSAYGKTAGDSGCYVVIEQ